MYGARGTRLDCIKLVHVLSTRVTTWTQDCTQFAEHLLGYIKFYIKMCLMQDARQGPKSVTEWRMDVSADADHRSPKCFSGSVLTLVPVSSSIDDDIFLTIDYTCQGQTYVKLSPAESEVVCAVWALRFALRYCESWLVLGDKDSYTDGGQRTAFAPDLPDWAVLRQREDNNACITLMERGWSQKLAHVCTVYGVSALWAAERIKEGRVEVVYEKTGRMIADPLTKLTRPQVLTQRGVLRELPALFIKEFV